MSPMAQERKRPYTKHVLEFTLATIKGSGRPKEHITCLFCANVHKHSRRKNKTKFEIVISIASLCY
jgi:hypothetical protein